MILATDDRPSEGAFGRIVVEGDARIVDEASQSGPTLEHVAHSFPEIAPRQPQLHRRPLPDAIENRPRAILTQLPPHILCRPRHPETARHQVLDRVHLSDERADGSARRRPVLGDLLVFPLACDQQCARMRQSEGGPLAREHLIDGEAVRHHGSVIAVQDLPPFLRRLARQDPIERHDRRSDRADVPFAGSATPSSSSAFRRR